MHEDLHIAVQDPLGTLLALVGAALHRALAGSTAVPLCILLLLDLICDGGMTGSQTRRLIPTAT